MFYLIYKLNAYIMRAAYNKKEILAKILKSDTFKNSKTYQNLLIYLVDASIKNETPKEYDIAIEVFGKDAKFNPSEDPSIRVYISNLRKKLKQYYSQEGKNDKVCLDIPPGHYVVVFSEKNSSRIKQIFTFQKMLYSLIGVLVPVILFFVYKSVEHNNSNPATSSFLESPLWYDFAKSTNRLLVVLGDDYFILNPRDVDAGIHRFHEINSDSDLEELKGKSVGYSNYAQTPYTFTPHLSLIPLIKVMPLLCIRDDVKIENSSRIKTVDFLDNDIIFFGSFRNIYILRQLLNGCVENIKVGAGENRLTLILSDSLKTYILEGYPQIKHTDYCLVRKIPGPKNNMILMIISFFETGMSRTSTYLTDTQNLKVLQEKFSRKYGQMPKYFDCLFKVSGLERTGLTIQTEYLSEIDPQQINIW